EPDLLLEIVDLVDDAVDLERHLAAPLADAPVIVEHAIETLHDRAFPGDGETKSGEPLQQGIVRRRRLDSAPFDRTDAVSEKCQRPPCGDPRIELAQVAGRGVTRVDEDL